MFLHTGESATRLLFHSFESPQVIIMSIGLFKLIFIFLFILNGECRYPRDLDIDPECKPTDITRIRAMIVKDKEKDLNKKFHIIDQNFEIFKLRVTKKDLSTRDYSVDWEAIVADEDVKKKLHPINQIT